MRKGIVLKGKKEKEAESENEEEPVNRCCSSLADQERREGNSSADLISPKRRKATNVRRERISRSSSHLFRPWRVGLTASRHWSSFFVSSVCRERYRWTNERVAIGQNTVQIKQEEKKNWSSLRATGHRIADISLRIRMRRIDEQIQRWFSSLSLQWFAYLLPLLLSFLARRDETALIASSSPVRRQFGWSSFCLCRDLISEHRSSAFSRLFEPIWSIHWHKRREEKRQINGLPINGDVEEEFEEIFFRLITMKFTSNVKVLFCRWNLSVLSLGHQNWSIECNSFLFRDLFRHSDEQNQIPLVSSFA